MNDQLNGKEVVSDGITIGDFFGIIKRNLALMLAIVILATACGFVVSFLLPEKYQSVEKASFSATNRPIIKVDPTTGKETITQPTTIDNINTMLAYADTVMDLSDEGVVIDRANYYYVQYSQNKDKYTGVDNFIENFDSKEDVYDKEIALSQEKMYFNKANISFKKPVLNEEETQFTFTVSYTDSSASAAEEKVKLLLFALKRECEEEFAGEIKYFGNIDVDIVDLGCEGTTNKVSKTLVVIVCFAVGLVLAVGFVYIRSIADNTIKNKEDLERITRASVLSAVANKE